VPNIRRRQARSLAVPNNRIRQGGRWLCLIANIRLRQGVACFADVRRAAGSPVGETSSWPHSGPAASVRTVHRAIFNEMVPREASYLSCESQTGKQKRVLEK